MLHSRGLGRLMSPRRITLTLGTAASTAVAAALISMATAPAAGAVTGADDDPLEDLFGSTGFNSWTPTADTDLGALAGGLDTSVDSYAAFGTTNFDDGFTALTQLLDPSAFSGGLPDNAIGDLAAGLDYATFASGLTPTLDPILSDIIGNLLGDCFLTLCFPI